MTEYNKIFLYIFIFLTVIFLGLSIGLFVLYINKDINYVQQKCYKQENVIAVPSLGSSKYYLQTISGKYVQSCVGCIGGVADCFGNGIYISDNQNGDTVSVSGNSIMMNTMNGKSLYLKTISIPSASNNIVCLTDKQSCNTQLTIIPYVSNNKDTLYAIRSQDGTYLGVQKYLMNVDILADGFKTVNQQTLFRFVLS
jgi:hypothetical protein